MRKTPFVITLILGFALLLSACAKNGNGYSFNNGNPSAQAAENQGQLADTGGNGNSQGQNNRSSNAPDNPGQGNGNGNGSKNNPGQGNGNGPKNNPGQGNGKNFPPGRSVSDDFRQKYGRQGLYQLSNLIGYTIVDADGNTIGKVDSLLVQPQSGKIRYIVLDIDNNIRADNDFVLIPVGALKMVNAVDNRLDDQEEGNDEDNDQNGNGDDDSAKPADDYEALVYRVDPGVLALAPGVSKDQLDNLDNRSWTEAVDSFWATQTGANPDERDNGQPLMRLAGGDFDVVDANGDKIGVVKDLLVDVPSAVIRYLAVDVRGTFDFNGQYILIPFNKIDWRMLNGNRVAFVNLTAEQMKSARRYLHLKDLPGPHDPGWKDSGND